MEFFREDDASEAMRKLDRYEFDGREISIVLAKDRRKTPSEMKHHPSSRRGGRRSPDRSRGRDYCRRSRSRSRDDRRSYDRHSRGRSDNRRGVSQRKIICLINRSSFK